MKTVRFVLFLWLVAAVGCNPYPRAMQMADGRLLQAGPQLTK